jgi:hypothetical protein
MPTSLEAQGSLTLSVSPAMYDLPVSPGQRLDSSIRIINPNPFDLTVYAEVVNFRPRGEGGDGLFNPVDLESADGSTLAEWFTLDSSAITIAPERSHILPFTLRVPEEASPGGHFAAILIGTRPLRSATGESNIQTAQVVTSLVFLRVAGDVVESGLIREFTTAKKLYNEPAAEFSLRFENRGNVHLQPQGEIKILNMWGSERGIIPINQYSGFGNVLPDSIRQFRFSWRGEWSVTDIGRYKALVTLAYGYDERRFAHSEINFWVLPIAFLAKVILTFVGVVFLIVWLIRIYIRRMLRNAGFDIDRLKNQTVETSSVSKSMAGHRLRLPNSASIVGALVDLRTKTDPMTSRYLSVASLKAKFDFLVASRLWLIGALIILLLVVLFGFFIRDARQTDHRGFEVGYINQDQVVTVNSEEIVYNRLRMNESEIIVSETATSNIDIVNRGGVPGKGAEIRLALEKAGYPIRSLRADFGNQNPRTVIVGSQSQDKLILELSRLLNNAPVSIVEGGDNIVTVYVGSEDFNF